MSQIRPLAIALVVAGSFSGLPARAQLMPARIVNPALYESASGEYVLDVDPSQRHGAGSATYRLNRRGQDVWAGHRPFTLIEAIVGDDGSVAGYSYEQGLEGFGRADVLHLWILDPAGRVRLDEAIPRHESMVVDGGPEPNARGVVRNPVSGRVTFRVADVAEPEVWRVYDLLTGKLQVAYRPASPIGDHEEGRSAWILDARAVAGTPLTLLYWSSFEYATSHRGAYFTLMDASGSIVWAKDLPRDYAPGRGAQNGEWKMAELADTSAILDVTRLNEFELRFAARRERVRYAVQRKAGVWRVEERMRQPWVEDDSAAKQEPTSQEIERPLKYLGAIPLEGDARDGSMGDVYGFDLDEKGHFAFARADPACHLTLVSGELGGKPRERSLGSLPAKTCAHPLTAWTGNRSWLVALEYAKAADGAAGFWVDDDTGATRPFMMPSGLTLRAIAGRPTGGVVLLAQDDVSNGSALVWMSTLGRQERSFTGTRNGGSDFLSLDDVAVTTSGAVVAVDNITHNIAVFDAAAALVKTIDLERAWGRAPSYPSGISPDIDGGFIVEDFGGTVPFVRMRADGSVRSDLKPRYADGRSTGRLFEVRATPDGTLWGSDGEALLKIGDDGIVAGAAGSEASPGALGAVAALVLDDADNIYAADRRTGTVHVFGPDGRALRTCTPANGDVNEALDAPSLTVTHEGRVFLRAEDDIGSTDSAAYLEFDAAGNRVAEHTWSDRLRLFNPVTGGFWGIGYYDFSLVDEKGERRPAIERRADRHWLDWIGEVAVAPNGSIAVMAHANLLQRAGQELSLNFYAADGAPQGLLRLENTDSAGPFAYDGSVVALWKGDEIRLLDVDGRSVARFRPRPGGTAASNWPLVIASEGRELWMFDASTRTLHRFAMP